jgi:hypothetical protein
MDISLGNLSAERIYSLICEQAEKGNWLILKNLHLTPQIIPFLVNLYEEINCNGLNHGDMSEYIQIEFEGRTLKIHKEFRLILSGEPSSYLSLSFLESCSKIVVDNVKSFSEHVHSNISLLSSLNEEESCSLSVAELKNQLAVAHSIFALRNNYGTFRSECKFNENDLLVAKHLLHSSLECHQLKKLVNVFLYSSKLEVEDDMDQIYEFLRKTEKVCGFDVRNSEEISKAIIRKIGENFWELCEISQELRDQKASEKIKQIKDVIRTLI